MAVNEGSGTARGRRAIRVTTAASSAGISRRFMSAQCASLRAHPAENLWNPRALHGYCGYMRVAAVQITSGPDTQANLGLVLGKIREAAAGGAELIVFPEATSQAFGTGELTSQAQELDGAFATAVAKLAGDLNVAVILGMFRPAGDRVRNTALIVGPGLREHYDKNHTYDAFSYRESDDVEPGAGTTVVDVAGVKVGAAICYDIRFPEQIIEMAQRGAQVIAVPTSWAAGPTKLEQWRLLAQARALDSTCVIVACDQAVDGNGWGVGHSMIVGANGAVIAEAGKAPEIIYADIDAATVEEARRALPVLEARG